jgi:PAS domain S-box-containing protein
MSGPEPGPGPGRGDPAGAPAAPASEGPAGAPFAAPMRGVRAVLDAPYAVLYAFDEIGGVLHAVYREGGAPLPTALWSRVFLDENLPITAAARTGVPVIHDPGGEAAGAYSGLAPGATGPGRLACLPLGEGGRVVGVALAGGCRAAAGDGDEALLAALAAHTGRLAGALAADLPALLARVQERAYQPRPAQPGAHPPPPAPEPFRDAAEIRAAVACGTFCWRLDEDLVHLDALAMGVFGSGEPYAGSPAPLLARIHRADYPLLRRSLAEAAAEQGAFALEYRVLRHDGQLRWVEARGRAARDAAGRPVLVGILTDTTGRPTWLQLASGPVDSMPDGLAVLDRDWRVVYVNETSARLAGMGRAELAGRPVADLLAQLDPDSWEPHFRRVAETRAQATFEVFFPAVERWYEVRAGVQPGGIAVYLRDVHARRTAAQRDRDRAQRRETSAQFAAALGATLGVDDVILVVERRLAEVFEADGVALHVTADGRLRLIAAAGYSAAGLARLRLLQLEDRAPIAESARDLRLRAYPDTRQIVAEYPHLARLVADTGAGALLVVPLARQGACLGVVAVRFDAPRAFSPGRLAFAERVCRLVTQALYRAHRYDDELSLAARLRDDVLAKPLHLVPGLELAAEYRAAGVGLGVGGDWFDVIPLTRGRVGLLVGDVEGHDAHAVGGMSTVRTAVRAYASEGYGPAAILGRVNRLVAELDPDLLATCCYAELDPATGFARIARAGHPAPVLRDGAGRARLIELPAGLPLGVDPGESYRAVLTPVPAGSLLALYSDGLVESRTVPIDEGTGRLVETLERYPGLAAADLARLIVARHLEREVLGDDVTLLLARCHE